MLAAQFRPRFLSADHHRNHPGHGCRRKWRVIAGANIEIKNVDTNLVKTMTTRAGEAIRRGCARKIHGHGVKLGDCRLSARLELSVGQTLNLRWWSGFPRSKTRDQK